MSGVTRPPFRRKFTSLTPSSQRGCRHGSSTICMCHAHLRLLQHEITVPNLQARFMLIWLVRIDSGHGMFASRHIRAALGGQEQHSAYLDRLACFYFLVIATIGKVNSTVIPQADLPSFDIRRSRLKQISVQGRWLGRPTLLDCYSPLKCVRPARDISR